MSFWHAALAVPQARDCENGVPEHFTKARLSAGLNRLRKNSSRQALSATSARFGVRQLAAAFLPASLLAAFRTRAQLPASKLACGKAAASCRTPKRRSE